MKCIEKFLLVMVMKRLRRAMAFTQPDAELIPLPRLYRKVEQITRRQSKFRDPTPEFVVHQLLEWDYRKENWYADLQKQRKFSRY